MVFRGAGRPVCVREPRGADVCDVMWRALLFWLWLSGPVRGCGPGCSCTGTAARCAGAGLKTVPENLPSRTLILDLSANNISTLHRASFGEVAHLRDLSLADNRLVSISSGALRLPTLTRLSLARCRLRRVPQHALRDMPKLLHLSLEQNELASLDGHSLSALTSLISLQLDRNELDAVPTEALQPLVNLQQLNLAGNQIASIESTSIPTLPDLHTLILRRNRIVHIDERAFVSVPAIRLLRVDENLLPEVPLAIQLLPHLEDLSVGNNLVSELQWGVLQRCTRLSKLSLRENPLRRIQQEALHNLPSLTLLVLSGCHELTMLPALNGSSRVETIRADRCALRTIPPHLCTHAPKLNTLIIRSNKLDEMPDLSECADLRLLDLSYNELRWVEGASLRGCRSLRDLSLAHNKITRLPGDLFHHTTKLLTLDVEDNEIEHIDSDVFVPISELQELNVGNNRFSQLPARGLSALRHLRAHNVPPLRRFPPPELFPSIQTLVLSYAYHCCEFAPLMEPETPPERPRGLSDFVLLPNKEPDLAAWANATDLGPHFANLTGPEGARLRELLAAWGSASPVSAASGRRVQCVPRPGPFLPCSDLFEWWTLRCGVWAVFLLALLGNGCVVLVLGAAGRARLDVPRFLVANLAAADLCMALYLGLLAVLDAATLGEFRAHAVAWQLSAGCRAAGFLAVLSSELSVYTLAVITLERNYAITHAMHLNKRLSLRRAAAVMLVGWALGVLAAALPLAGVSDYRKVAVCLPFDTDGSSALAYVAALPLVNGAAFAVLLGCYLKMYCAIRGSQAWNSNDSRIAKRMALLVFTDFLCWSPIAFFALTATFGVRLVSLEQAKVLTVFVLPLNSCCNPFLYAILTKQFKKDCALVCKTIEESRVTRGIGRCRHSSNFSNRQTPANTSSQERSAHAPACVCRTLLPPAPPAPAPRLLRWLCGVRPPAPAPPPARAGSVSSSAEFSSSRSESGARGRRAWRATRKTSQDSNLSSSGSNNTASTTTWRASRRPRLTRQPALDEAGAPPHARHLHTIPSAVEAEHDR